MTKTNSSPPENTTIFFDGVCNLCNGFVSFLVQRDRRRKLRYAPLQGMAAQKHLPSDWTSGEPRSIVVMKNEQILAESQAVLEIARTLGGAWSFVFYVGILIPRPIRDALYRWVARNRYQWFGRQDTCRLPTAEEKTLFLD